MLRTFLLIATLTLGTLAVAQQSPVEQPNAYETTPMRVCSPKNPPPCATPPQVIAKVDPAYAEIARQAKKQGTVVLWLVVSPAGLPENIKVARSLDMELDRKAVEAAAKWRFKPATFEGKPVAVQINIEMNFKLY